MRVRASRPRVHRPRPVWLLGLRRPWAAGWCPGTGGRSVLAGGCAGPSSSQCPPGASLVSSPSEPPASLGTKSGYCMRCPHVAHTRWSLSSAAQRPWSADREARGLFSPEEAEEAVGFQDHAQERPAQQDDGHAPQEEAGALEFVPLEEEGERPPQADDEGEASQEQQLWGRERWAGESEHAGSAPPTPGPRPAGGGAGPAPPSQAEMGISVSARPSRREPRLAGAREGQKGPEAGVQGRCRPLACHPAQPGFGSQALPHVRYHFSSHLPSNAEKTVHLTEAESQASVGWAATPESRGAGGAPGLHSVAL